MLHDAMHKVAVLADVVVEWLCGHRWLCVHGGGGGHLLECGGWEPLHAEVPCIVITPQDALHLQFPRHQCTLLAAMSGPQN